MITTITTFPLPKPTTEEQARAHFAKVAPKFQVVPGLIRKQFLFSPEENSAGGVYLWQTREDAQRFIEGKLIGMIRAEFGVEPRVQYFSTPVVVDNLSQVIIA